jgi:hypothetical protein
VKDFLFRAYSKVSEPDSGEIAPATTQTTTEKRGKTYNATKIKGTSHEGFAEHHEHAGETSSQSSDCGQRV